MPTPEDFVAAYAKAKGLQWGVAIDELQDRLNSGAPMPPDVAKYISEQESGLLPLAKRASVSAVSGALTPVGSLVDIGAGLAGYKTKFGEDLWNLPGEVPKGPRVPAAIPLIGDESIGGIAGQIVGGTIPAAMLAGAPEGTALAKVFGTRGALGGLAAKGALSKLGLPEDTLAILKAEKGTKAAGGLLDEAVATKEKAAPFVALNRKRRAYEDVASGAILGGLYGHATGETVPGAVIGAATGRIGAAIGSHFANKPRFNERVDLSNAIEYLSKYYGEPISTTVERFKAKPAAAVNEALAAAGSPDIIPMTETDAHQTQTIMDIYGPAPDNWTGSYGDWIQHLHELTAKARRAPYDPADLAAQVEALNNVTKPKAEPIIKPLSLEEKVANYNKHKDIVDALTTKEANGEILTPQERQQRANSKKVVQELVGEVKKAKATPAASEIGAKAVSGKEKKTATTAAETPIAEATTTATEPMHDYSLDSTTAAAIINHPDATPATVQKAEEVIADNYAAMKAAEKKPTKNSKNATTKNPSRMAASDAERLASLKEIQAKQTPGGAAYRGVQKQIDELETKIAGTAHPQKPRR